MSGPGIATVGTGLLLWEASPDSDSRRIFTMKLKGIDWVGVRTNSFEPMKHFAEQTLGLSAVHEARDFVVYRLPNGDKFEIFGPKSPFAPEQFARNEVVCGFHVDDIDRAREELQAAGIGLLDPAHRDSPGGGFETEPLVEPPFRFTQPSFVSL